MMRQSLFVTASMALLGATMTLAIAGDMASPDEGQGDVAEGAGGRQ